MLDEVIAHTDAVVQNLRAIVLAGNLNERQKLLVELSLAHCDRVIFARLEEIGERMDPPCSTG